MFWKKNISKLSDEEILQKYLISSNAEYIGELYQRYVPLLYGIGLKYLQSANKAQNAVMQLFENTTTKTTLNEVKEFRAWICTMMKNQCMQVKPADSKINTFKQNEICSIFETEQTDEKNRLLQTHIKKLPVEQRIPIIRFFTDEMSYMDIAQSTGRNLNQVKNLIGEGMQNLKGYDTVKGHPTNILVKKSLCSAADEEALRLLINGPDWTIGNKQVELEIKF